MKTACYLRDETFDTNQKTPITVRDQYQLITVKITEITTLYTLVKVQKKKIIFVKEKFKKVKVKKWERNQI